MNDLDDIQQVLSQMRSDTGSYPDRPDFDLTSLPSSSMGRLFGERNLGNRQISAFKPTGEEENFSLMCFTFQEKVNMPEGFLFCISKSLILASGDVILVNELPGCQKVRVEGDNLKIHFFGALHPCNQVSWVASLGNAI